MLKFRLKHDYPVEVEGETEDPQELLRFIDMLPKIAKKALKLERCM